MSADPTPTPSHLEGVQTMTLIDHDRIERLAPEVLKPYAGNARTHSKKQIRQIAQSIERFGFTNPVLIDEANGIMAGHGRVLAAQAIGLTEVPCLRLAHLSETEKRAYILADNKLALNAGWDQELLAIELQGLIEANYSVEVTGFTIGEVDAVLQAAQEAAPAGSDAAEDACPEPAGVAVTRPGDVWQLGRHRLICGDAQDAGVYARLLGSETVDAVFTDPPYNVPIDGHVSGLGATKHREFAFASGEMSRDAFTAFLTTTLGHAAAACRDGAIAFVCMDWRHMGELLGGRRSGLHRAEESLRLEQDQRRHGHLLPLQARAGLRVQGRHGPAHQHLRARRRRAATAPTSGITRASTP